VHPTPTQRVPTQADLSELEQIHSLANLKTLYLSGCPLSRTPDYRRRVIAASSATLEQLDADELTAAEKSVQRQEAAHAAASAETSGPSES
jgi:Leucine-rich repeat (LRR) protein